MASADPVRILAQVYALLGRPSLQKLPADDVHAARIGAGMEILRAISLNPQNSFHGSLATLVTVTHNSFLPAHDGEPGIPLIVPFSGAAAQEGIPAKPDQIDSFRLAAASALYTGALDALAVSHDAADSSGLPSPVAGRYSIVNGRLKFTGLSAQVPLIQLTRLMADTGVPENYEPTVVKLTIPRLVRPGDALAALAGEYGRMGLLDLALIANGAEQVSPIPDVAAAQRMGVT